MYFSKEAVLSLYRKLSSLYPKDDIEQQGGTQFVSAIKYFLAMDFFKKNKGKSCDTKKKEDKDFFILSVGKVVLLSENGNNLATKNFAKSVGESRDFDVGSNFFSVNAVAKSMNTHVPQKFPKRYSQLLTITEGIVDTYSDGYENFANDKDYLGGNDTKYAILFLWLNRFSNFSSEESIYDDSLSYLKKDYSSKLVDSLKWDSPDVKKEVVSIIADIQLVDNKTSFELEDFFLGDSSELAAFINKPYNRIIFGAPGTGKSHRLKGQSSYFGENLERVTFHPNYSYAQFVGTYKPVQNLENSDEIRYEYVPGPFMRIYVSAKKNPEQNFLLLIEEINRANVAAVFGDVFQLLDRKPDGTSEYPVAVSEDIKNYLAKNGIQEDEFSIPSNMYIWATMNSADQGVFPMDTAFKRRWEFEYIGIDENEKEVENFYMPINDNKKVKWNELRKAINNKLIELGINEDKLLGPFFLNKSMLENAMNKESNFIKSFESKVLMYLFEDAAKMKVRQLFNQQDNKYIYSEICKKFEKDGLAVFNFTEMVSIEDIESSSQTAEE